MIAVSVLKETLVSIDLYYVHGHNTINLPVIALYTKYITMTVLILKYGVHLSEFKEKRI